MGASLLLDLDALDGTVTVLTRRILEWVGKQGRGGKKKWVFKVCVSPDKEGTQGFLVTPRSMAYLILPCVLK